MIDDAARWAKKIKECLKDYEKCGSEWAWKVMQNNVADGVRYTFAVEASALGAVEGIVAGMKGKATGTIERQGSGFLVSIRIDDAKQVGAGIIEAHAKASLTSARAYKGTLSSPSDVFPFAKFMGKLGTEEAILHALQGFGIPVEVGRDLVAPVLRWLGLGLSSAFVKSL
ncbi:MAG: hypothetical protein HYY84_18015, partial [Deltaproteobacteria bacterium]|nr:hypothetical protein [Deltaproteobacteria bacterium]